MGLGLKGHGDRLPHCLQLLILHLSEKGVVQSLIHCQPFRRIKHQHFTQKIQCLIRSPRESLFEIRSRFVLECPQVHLGILVSNKAYILLARRPNERKNVIQLVILYPLQLFCIVC